MKDNSGPAFPQVRARIHEGYGEFGYEPWEGLTARDYFASMAMQAMIGSTNLRVIGLLPAKDQDVDPALAQRAYEIAAAMVRERNK